MDLSKAFDFVSQDLLFAKLKVYVINGNSLPYLHLYLPNRKQCVRINTVTSDFETIIPGVPQSSIVGPICLIAFLMTSFILLKKQAFTILRMTTP